MGFKVRSPLNHCRRDLNRAPRPDIVLIITIDVGVARIGGGPLNGRK